MNEEIYDLLLILKKDILEEPIIVEYLRLEKIINNSPEISSLRKKIEFLKKCNVDEQEKEQYYNLLKEYNSNPLVIQYNNISSDVMDFLDEIKKGMNL